MDKTVEQEKPMDRTKDVPEVTRTEQSIAFYLDSKLEQFSNGRTYGSDPSNKTNGYHAAKVPDWQLRRWADETKALTAEIADLRQRTESLWDAIKHGDDEHRAWLKEAINAHLAGEAVPETRGKGRKEAEISDLRAQLDEAMDLIEVLLDNDPYDPISDHGHVVLDMWREDARAILAKRKQP